jgi:hypothetical protein
MVGPFHFIFYITLFWLRASLMSLRHFVGAEAGCNWYLCDKKDSKFTNN